MILSGYSLSRNKPVTNRSGMIYGFLQALRSPLLSKPRKS